MLPDVKYAFRSLLKTPGFTFVAVLILALCIGANTAIFTVLKKVVLDPLPFAASERLVVLRNAYPLTGGMGKGLNAAPDYVDRRQMTDVFHSVALLSNRGFELGATASPQRVQGEVVTPDYFQVLPISPLLGRNLAPGDAQPGATKVAVLSHQLWRERFAADRNILDKDIRLDGVSYRVVGVLPPQFSAPLFPDSRVWVSATIDAQTTSNPMRHWNSWDMIGRLREGVSLQHAQQRLDALNKANFERIPEFRELIKQTGFTTVISSMKDEIVGETRSTLRLLQAAAALVLLIGCCNVAGLMLVRANARIKELVIRFALGASRWLLARQLLVESLLLALLGGTAGLLVGWFGLQLLGALGADELPRAAGLSLDAAALGFNSLAAFATGLLFGLIPMYSLWRQDLARLSHSTEKSSTAGRGAARARSTLAAGQISLAFILLVGAGLLVFSFMRLLEVKPGFRTEGVATAHIGLPVVRYGDIPARAKLIADVIEQLKRTPGIEHASAAAFLPFSGREDSAVIRVDGRPAEESAIASKYNYVSPDYFKTLNVPLRGGRMFSDTDDAKAQQVVIIDEALARKYWPQGNALGAKIGLFTQGPEVTVVGVVGQVKTANLGESKGVGQLYLSTGQFPMPQFFLAVRGKTSEAALFNSMRLAVAQIDPELALANTKTMHERIAASMTYARAAMILCAIFGGVAALLAAIGIYGMLSYAVAQRTREFGIRLALGAEPGGLLKSVMAQGLRTASIGLLVGTCCALFVTRLMSSLLYGVTPSDPFVFAGIALFLICAAALACYLPARRVSKVDPLVALRAE